MELRHLRYFVAAAEEQNVTRAAARLNVTQPSMSRQILNLESELGFDLFDHGAKAIRLTDAGRVFLTEVRELLIRLDEAILTAKAATRGEHGEIHVGYAPSLTVDLLPEALRHIQSTTPGLRVQLHDLSTEEMRNGLQDGTIHAALMVETTGMDKAGLVFEELRRYAVRVAMHRTHALAGNRKLRLQQIAGEPLIAYPRTHYPEYRAWLDRLFEPIKRVPLIAEEHDSAISLIASVEAGRGLALVQDGFERLSGKRLKLIPLMPAPPPFVVGLAYLKGTHSIVTHHFISAVKRAASAGNPGTSPKNPEF